MRKRRRRPKRALQLNPDFNQGLWARGAAAVFAGDYDAGIAAAAQAVDIDIRDPYVHLYSRIAGYGHFAWPRRLRRGRGLVLEGRRQIRGGVLICQIVHDSLAGKLDIASH